MSNFWTMCFPWAMCVPKSLVKFFVSIGNVMRKRKVKATMFRSFGVRFHQRCGAPPAAGPRGREGGIAERMPVKYRGELQARAPGAVEAPQAVRVGRVPVGTDVDRADHLALPALRAGVGVPGELQEARLVEQGG